MKEYKKIDETIDATCDWIQEQLKETSAMETSLILSETIKALAKLISARARCT